MSGEVETQLIREEETPSARIIQAVATYKGISATDIAPLHETVDTDALNELFDQRPPDTDAQEFTFSYCDCEITVRSPDTVTVVPTE